MRCVYHGWKFDVDGAVVDTPAEPPDSELKQRLRHQAYPTKEVAGVVFAFLGSPEDAPLMPQYEWMRLPESRSKGGGEVLPGPDCPGGKVKGTEGQ